MRRLLAIVMLVAVTVFGAQLHGALSAEALWCQTTKTTLTGARSIHWATRCTDSRPMTFTTKARCRYYKATNPAHADIYRWGYRSGSNARVAEGNCPQFYYVYLVYVYINYEG